MTTQAPIFSSLLTPIALRVVPTLRGWMSGNSALPMRRMVYRCVTDPYTNVHARPISAATDFGMTVRGTLGGLVVRRVFHFGLYEPVLTRKLAGTLQPGDVFVDVGANIGYFSMLASKCVGTTGKVIAIEAAPSTFATLQAHLAANQLSNVHAVHCAVYDQQTKLPIFYLPEEENTGGASLLRQIGPQEAIVDAAPLSELIDPGDVARIAAIKIDVEGAELHALRGMHAMMPNLRSNVVFYIEALREHVAELCTFMNQYGFETHAFSNPPDPLERRHIVKNEQRIDNRVDAFLREYDDEFVYLESRKSGSAA